MVTFVNTPVIWFFANRLVLGMVCCPYVPWLSLLRCGLPRLPLLAVHHQDRAVQKCHQGGQICGANGLCLYRYFTVEFSFLKLHVCNSPMQSSSLHPMPCIILGSNHELEKWYHVLQPFQNYVYNLRQGKSWKLLDENHFFHSLRNLFLILWLLGR